MFPIITLFLGIIFACFTLYVVLLVLSFFVRLVGSPIREFIDTINHLH